MGRSSLRPLADLVLDGHLESLLTERRSQGVSYARIALELHGQGIEVTGETVRTWCSELGIEAS